MAKLLDKSLIYNKEYEAWLEEIMTEYNKLLKVIFLYPAKLFLLMRLSSMLYFSIKDNSNDETFWMPITVSLMLFFSLLMQRKYPHHSAVFILIYLEGFNFGTIVRYYTGQNKNNNFYPVISGFYTFFVEFFLFKINRWVLLFMQIKTMAIWLIVETNQISFEKNLNITNLITLLGMSITLTVLSYTKDRVLGIIFRYRRTIIRDQNNLKTIVDCMPDGLVVLNDKFEVKLSNLSLNTILDIQLPDNFIANFKKLQYMKDKRLYTIGNNEFLYTDVQNYLKSRSNSSVSFGITQIDDKYYEWKGNLCKWNNKDSLILVVRDCTTLIELEKSQARQLYQTAVLRAVSHELRTPTSAIISANEKLTFELPRDEKYPEEALAVINVSGQLLLNLINNLLDFVQINSGTFKIFKSYFSLNDLIGETLNLLPIQAKLKGLCLTSYIDPSIPLNIKNDSERLKQILINLLSNALKYTQVGSISLIASYESHKLKITIRDTGIGMSPTQLSKLFQIFGCIRDIDSQVHGAGLKMHISNLLAFQLGNEPIDVESEVGLGSSFSFFTDIGKVKPDRIDSYESVSEHLETINIRSSIQKRSFKTSCSKVLIVDDNEFNRYVLGELLKLEKIEFDEAINGAEAVEMIVNNDRAMSSYKAVIMDCQMPVMDGWQATQKLVKMRADGELRDLPAIIGYSAYSSREDEIKSKETGMSAFLQKPASRVRLARELRKYL